MQKRLPNINVDDKKAEIAIYFIFYHSFVEAVPNEKTVPCHLSSTLRHQSSVFRPLFLDSPSPCSWFYAEMQDERALPHRDLPRSARTHREHASSAPYRGTDYLRFSVTKLAVLVETPKVQSNSITRPPQLQQWRIKLSPLKIYLIASLVNKNIAF